MTEQTYTVKQVSKMMNCHPLTVIRWIKKGELEGFKVGKDGSKAHWHIPKSAFDKRTGTVAHGVTHEA